MPQGQGTDQEQKPEARPAGTEHSQLWLFLQEHYKKIILGISLIVLIAAVSSGYQYYQNQRMEQARQELSKINSGLQGQEKQQALQELLSEVPQQMETAVLLELANTAQDQQNFSDAEDYWARLAESSQDPGLQAAARLGQARALAEQGENGASLDILEEMLQQAPKEYQESIYFEIAALAEKAQEWEKALEAYEFLAQSQELESSQEDFLQHKISQLEQKLDANGA
ncbi:MAG: tetratricopeptide repeat protein [Thermodesulfobacteriota bacterium]